MNSTEARAILVSRILSEEAYAEMIEKSQNEFSAGDGIKHFPYRSYLIGEFSETIEVNAFEFPGGFLAGSEIVGSCNMCPGRFQGDLSSEYSRVGEVVVEYSVWREAMEKFVEHDLEWFETKEQLDSFIYSLKEDSQQEDDKVYCACDVDKDGVDHVTY